MKLKRNHIPYATITHIVPSLPGPGPASCSWWAFRRRLGGRGTKGNGAHQGPMEDSGMLGLLARERNYLFNKENNSVCSSSCFKEKNCLGKVRKIAWER